MPFSIGASGQMTPASSKKPMLAIVVSEIRPSGVVNTASSNPARWAASR